MEVRLEVNKVAVVSTVRVALVSEACLGAYLAVDLTTSPMVITATVTQEHHQAEPTLAPRHQLRTIPAVRAANTAAVLRVTLPTHRPLPHNSTDSVREAMAHNNIPPSRSTDSPATDRRQDLVVIQDTPVPLQVMAKDHREAHLEAMVNKLDTEDRHTARQVGLTAVQQTTITTNTTSMVARLHIRTPTEVNNTLHLLGIKLGTADRRAIIHPSQAGSKIDGRDFRLTAHI